MFYTTDTYRQFTLLGFPAFAQFDVYVGLAVVNATNSGNYTLFNNDKAGLANCRSVAHQSDRQGENAPKGYVARQEMTPEIAQIHVDRLHIMEWYMEVK